MQMNFQGIILKEGMHTVPTLIRLFITMTKYLSKTTDGKDLFWLIVLEVSAQSSWLLDSGLMVRRKIMASRACGRD
jgi:hypothetical protein